MSEEPQKWIVAEEDEYIHVVPDFDSRPHANVLEPVMGKFYLSAEDCTCNPEIRLGDKDGEFVKQMVIHNSFIQQEEIKKSIANIIKK